MLVIEACAHAGTITSTDPNSRIFAQQCIATQDMRAPELRFAQVGRPHCAMHRSSGGICVGLVILVYLVLAGACVLATGGISCGGISCADFERALSPTHTVSASYTGIDFGQNTILKGS